MKDCRYCKKSYPESYFGIALTTKEKIYRRHKCRFCYQITKNTLRNNIRNWILDIKKKSFCIRCGNKDYRVLDFHHLNNKNKDFAISSAYTNMGKAQINEEIKKCAILCANCHRIEHWRDNN